MKPSEIKFKKVAYSRDQYFKWNDFLFQAVSETNEPGEFSLLIICFTTDILPRYNSKLSKQFFKDIAEVKQFICDLINTDTPEANIMDMMAAQLEAETEKLKKDSSYMDVEYYRFQVALSMTGINMNRFMDVLSIYQTLSKGQRAQAFKELVTC